MTNRSRLLYALVLLPTLLLTSCYKDFDKVRIKPFKPDLVVPLATADNITFADMLVKEDERGELDTCYGDKRIGLKYNLKAGANISVSLKPNCDLLVFAGNDEMFSSVFSSYSEGNVEKIIELKFKDGTVLTAGKDVELPLAGGAGFLELQGNIPTKLDEGKVVDFSQINEDLTKKTTIQVSGAGIESVRVKLGNIPAQGAKNKKAVPIKVYRGLLWYSGKLTDPRVVLHVGREGWVRRAKVNYWFDNFYLETKKGEKQAIVGEGRDALPFNKVGESVHKGTLAASDDTVVTPPYLVNTSNLEVLSKEWPLTIYTGSAFCKPAEDEVTIYAVEKANNFGTRVEFKLPFTGRFNALIREFKAEDKEGIELPDVNKLLQDSGGKVNVKSSFTDNDTVLLHFYFKNATPMDIYLATRIGENNKVPKGEVAQKASVIEGLNSHIDDEVLKGGALLTIGKFDFFKAVEGADASGEHGTATGSKSKVATIAIPYSEYEEARKSAAGRQVRALLLFRSPNGDDGQPIVVSPRLKDYVSIRLGVEVKPEVSIELMNKK